MLDLAIGMRVFHNGVPVELLYRVDVAEPPGAPQCERWKVRPLFVNRDDCERLFSATDRITFLHTRGETGRVSAGCRFLFDREYYQ